MIPDEEERLLRSVAIKNANSILIARQRAEQELIATKEALERKTQELAHTLSSMRATLESTWDGILVTNHDGKVADFNEKYVEMWQIPRGLMESGGHREILEFTSRSFKDGKQFLDRIEEIYTSPPAQSFDVLELKDGRVYERFSKIQFVNERNVGRVWSFRDITDNRRAEEALRDESRMLERLNGTGIVLSSTLDLQALVQAVTDAATELCGARFGAFFYNVSGEKDPSFMMCTLSGAADEPFEEFGQPWATPLFGQTFKGEGPIRRDDVMNDRPDEAESPKGVMPKSRLALRSYMAVPVISRSGEVIGGLFFGHPDVGVFTERAERLTVGIAAQAAVAIDNARLYEAAQRSADERSALLESERVARSQAERASYMKDEFLAMLSHELRTPLSAILGWAQVLRFRSTSPASLQQGLEAVERNARVQSQLIEDLLDMSRITSGKLRLDIQPVEPVAVVEAAIETVRPAASAKGIRLEKVLDTVAGPVSGDPNRLQQIVWNLLSNAIKFTPKGGKVQILLQRVNSHIEISVADTGIGIKPAFLPFVFERFRQADASSTRSFGGLGLGLSIVKHLVELHGGSVRVQSPGEDCGTTFVVNLPLTVVHRSAESGERVYPRAPQPVPFDFKRIDLSGVKVLVVDDEADARELIKRVLAECDAEVLTASKASEALLLVEKERPDVLISDIGMPDVDGYELLRRVRALGQASGGRIPAIALTAFARSKDRTRALRAGFLVHVSKPTEPSELVATVASVAGRIGDAGGD